MLLQIDIYPNGGSDSHSQKLFVNPATINNRYQRRIKGSGKDKDDGDIGLIVTVGRKVGMDIVFKDEKSLSRRHAALRFIATKTGNNNDNDNGYFAEPRNEEETSACENSEYGICLVLENTGKVGSYVASRDDTVQTKDEEQKNNNNKNNGVDSDDETTDDEGNVSQHPTQMSQMYATSMSTQTGEKIDDAPPRISNAIRNYFGNHAVKLLKLKENENQILSFDNTTTNNDEDNDNTSEEQDINNKNDSVPIMIQFGSTNDQFTQPTIKITRIPMNVVMSSTVPSTVRDSLRFCGGLIQNGGLPRDGETTHLVVTEQMPVAKQILAWCYGITIVSPNYIQALNDHEDIYEPFPDCCNFPPTNDNNTFWDYEHNKKLLSNYIMLSADESSEFESEHLAVAAGGCVKRLYDAGKKPTKAKVNTFTKHVQSLISDNKNNTTTVVLLSSSGSNSKSKSANVNLLIKKIKDLGIETLTPKVLAKAITKQESDLIALKNGTITSTTEKSKIDSAAEASTLKVQKRPKSNHDDAQDLVPDNNDDSSCLVSEATPAISVVKDINSNNDNRKRRKATIVPHEHQVQQRALEGADANGWFVVAPKDNRERMRQVASEAYRKKTGGDIERSASTNGIVQIIIIPMMTQPPPSSSLIGRQRRGRPSQRGGDVPNFKKFKKNSFRPVGPNDRVVLLQSTSSARQNHHELSAEQREIEEDQRLADALFRGDPVPVQRKRRRN
jgi:hypothetical protein